MELYTPMSYQILHKRGFMSFFWRSGPAVSLLLLAFCLLGLGACGKRPVQVDAPPSAQEHMFPRVYPDINTDPKP